MLNNESKDFYWRSKRFFYFLRELDDILNTTIVITSTFCVDEAQEAWC